MRLPICAKPLPDELWQSYIMRLAVMNDCSSLEQFESDFIYGTKRKKRSSMEYPESLSLVCDRMSNNHFFPKLLEAIAMTPFYAEADVLPEGKQARLSESILFDINEPVTPNHRPQKRFCFRVCPECMKNDIDKYGFWYLHVKHHLPNVCVCREHKVPLLYLEYFDKRVSNKPNIEKSLRAEVRHMEAALLHSEEMEMAYERNKGILISKVCLKCGKEYFIHPYSERTGAGCPFCRKEIPWKDFIQHRLNLLHGDEYILIGPFLSIGTASIQHIPCGDSKRNLDMLLWNKKAACSGCKALTVLKMQERIDPEKREFVIRKLFRNEHDSRMVTVTHLACGQTFDIHPEIFMNRPHCIFCEKKQKALENSIVHSDYEIVSEYQNNRENVLFRHKECGCVFSTSKTSFLAGMRCPICTNHYDFRMVSKAVEDCTEDYDVERSQKRGTVMLYYNGKIIREEISYTKVMNDLQADTSFIIKHRKLKYIPPRSIRRRIFDAVSSGTKNKGFWEAKDGIEGAVVTRGDRNILQDLTNQGYIIRLEKGKYKVHEDTYKCSNEYSGG